MMQGSFKKPSFLQIMLGMAAATTLVDGVPTSKMPELRSKTKSENKQRNIEKNRKAQKKARGRK